MTTGPSKTDHRPEDRLALPARWPRLRAGLPPARLGVRVDVLGQRVQRHRHRAHAGLLDLENLIADTNTGTVCRVGRHRSWGKANTVLGYWAEAHTVPSPTGTRAVFASDWGGGNSVDTYVLELPAYTP